MPVILIFLLYSIYMRFGEKNTQSLAFKMKSHEATYRKCMGMLQHEFVWECVHLWQESDIRALNTKHNLFSFILKLGYLKIRCVGLNTLTTLLLYISRFSEYLKLIRCQELKWYKSQPYLPPNWVHNHHLRLINDEVLTSKDYC